MKYILKFLFAIFLTIFFALIIPLSFALYFIWEFKFPDDDWLECKVRDNLLLPFTPFILEDNPLQYKNPFHAIWNIKPTRL